MAMPFVLGLGSKNPLAVWISAYTGTAALILTILTDHATGLVPVIPYWLHVVVDRLVGVVFIVVPFAFGFQGSTLGTIGPTQAQCFWSPRC
jgi:hypothetical protein